jgi:putative Mg2+ transporter-C (MgtC) family protein
MESLLQSEIVWRLIVAAFLGALLGFERSLSGKHAGMRTYALVSLGSALFVLIGVITAYQLSGFSGVNPVQIASSIVVGIGFIGAGLAALRGEHPELTTASGIWLAAGVGMAAGFGLSSLAIASTALGILVFWLLAKLERKMSAAYGIKHEG